MQFYKSYFNADTRHNKAECPSTFCFFMSTSWVNECFLIYVSIVLTYDKAPPIGGALYMMYGCAL